MAWLRSLGTALLAFGASWGAAISYWRASNRMPATGDLVLLLLVLPLALLLGFWLLKKLWRRVTAPAAAVPAMAAAVPAAPAATPSPAPALSIVATAVHTPHGADVGSLHALLEAKKARPGLDAELLDDQGYPVMAARIAGLDVAAARADVMASLAPGVAAPPFSDEQWRALAAGAAVLDALNAALAEALQQLPPGATLQLLTLWPSDWQPAQRDAATSWLRQVVARGGWPTERIVTPTMTDGDDAAAVLARLLGGAALPAADGAHLALVLACGSLLGETSIDALSNAGQLFSSRHPQGQMPGEGAAALLLTDAGSAAAIAAHDPQPLPELRAVVHARRAGSADADKRVDGATLRAAGKEALAAAGSAAARITVIAADTDHRGSRVMEVMGLLSDELPQLDAGDDLLSIGAACGSCGDVTYLTALTVAAHACIARDGAALCIGNQDPYRRSVAVLLPPSTASNEQPSLL